jgi:hypothetical protein
MLPARRQPVACPRKPATVQPEFHQTIAAIRVDVDEAIAGQAAPPKCSRIAHDGIGKCRQTVLGHVTRERLGERGGGGGGGAQPVSRSRQSEPGFAHIVGRGDRRK